MRDCLKSPKRPHCQALLKVAYGTKTKATDKVNKQDHYVAESSVDKSQYLELAW